MDPSLGDLIDRFRIQKVDLLAPPPECCDEVGRFEDVQVFAHRLADHVQALGQLPEALSVAGIQTIEQLTTTRVSQRFEDVHHDWPISCLLASELEVLRRRGALACLDEALEAEKEVGPPCAAVSHELV